MLTAQIESFQNLLQVLKKNDTKIIFLVGKPGYTNFKLETELTNRNFQTLKKFFVVEFDTYKNSHLTKFFNMRMYELEILCLLPEPYPNFTVHEQRLSNFENLENFLLHLFFKIRHNLP